MQTTPLHFGYASSGQLAWASVGVARAGETSAVQRGSCEYVLAKCIRVALLVPSSKCGCHGHRGFGRVKSVAVCTGIDLGWREGGAPTVVAAPSARSNPALKRDRAKARGPLAPR